MVVDVECELLRVGEISVIEALSMEAGVAVLSWWGGQGIVSPTTRNEKVLFLCMCNESEAQYDLCSLGAVMLNEGWK